MRCAAVLSGRISDARSGQIIVPHVARTTNALERMRGLLGRPAPAADAGLLIVPCGSVHTWFMRYAIDVVYLDRDGVVLRVVPAMAPWRMSRQPRARSTLELCAGGAASAAIVPGQRLVWSADA